MGKTTVSVDVINTIDLGMSEIGKVAAHEIRHEQILFTVDTGATFVSLPIDIIERLGLHEVGKTKLITANGTVERRTYSPVRIAIMGRQTDVNVIELPIGTPSLLGVIPLEALDLIVNPRMQRLEGNPAHGGEYMIEAL